MVSQIQHAIYIIIFAVFIIAEVRLVKCNLFKKCCASDEGLKRISLNYTDVKYVCSSEFDENVLPLMFKNSENVEYGIPQICGTKSCTDKTVDGQKIIQLYCDTKEKRLTNEIPTTYKCCPWNSTINVTQMKCGFSENPSEIPIYDIGSQAYNIVIRKQPPCDREEYLLNMYIQIDDFTIDNGKLITQFRGSSIPFEKETFCFDLNTENYQNKIFVRLCNTPKLINKCCDWDKALKTVDTKFVCTSEVGAVVPLKTHRYKATRNIDIGIPKICNFSETCIDKNIDDKTIVELFCDSKSKAPPGKLPTIYKCCPLNMFYDESTKSCVEDLSSDEELFFDSSALLYNLVFGVPSAAANMSLVDYTYEDKFTINNGILELNNSKIFENGTYCIDRRRSERKMYIRAWEYAVEACRNRICIPKCCLPGEIMFKAKMTDKTSCVANYDIPFFPNFTNMETNTLAIPENMALLRNIECKRYMSSGFKLYDDGSLFAETKSFRGIDQIFCIEYLDSPIFKQYIALICFPTPTGGLHNFYYLAGLLISIIFLAITLTIYFFLPELQNLHGRTVMSHSTSLLASYIMLTMVKKPFTSYSESTCLILGYGIMYTFLVAFLWLNVMCFDIWYTFGVVKARGLNKHNNMKKFLLYSLYAYVLPSLITGIAIYIDLFADVPKRFKPHFGSDACWFDLRPGRNYLPYTIFFAIPVASIIFFNIVLFILTVRHCLKVRGDIHRMQHADSPKKKRFFTDKATLIMNFKLFIVMGISWIFEMISIYVRHPVWLWYMLDSINVLQGLWIFCIFVLKANVWKALRKKLGYQVLREGSQTQSTTMSTKNSGANTTSFRLNGNIKQEEKDLLHTAIRNSIGKSSNDPMLK